VVHLVERLRFGQRGPPLVGRLTTGVKGKEKERGVEKKIGKTNERNLAVTPFIRLIVGYCRVVSPITIVHKITVKYRTLVC